MGDASVRVRKEMGSAEICGWNLLYAVLLPGPFKRTGDLLFWAFSEHLSWEPLGAFAWSWEEEFTFPQHWYIYLFGSKWGGRRAGILRKSFFISFYFPVKEE